jgi:hypothetical protein
MKKILNAEGVANELRGGSAFFPSYNKQSTPSPTPHVAEETTPKNESLNPSPSPIEKQTPVISDPTKRSFIKRTFDIFEDQLNYLSTESLQDKLIGKDSSMNAWVREAIDDWIQKRKAKK